MNGEGAMNFGMNEIECSQAEIRYFYLKHVKPVILKDALFADGTADYVQMLNEKYFFEAAMPGCPCGKWNHRVFLIIIRLKFPARKKVCLTILR